MKNRSLHNVTMIQMGLIILTDNLFGSSGFNILIVRDSLKPRFCYQHNFPKHSGRLHTAVALFSLVILC